MRPFLLLVALLYMTRVSVFAASLGPESLQAPADTTQFLQKAPQLSWTKKHKSLLLKSSSALLATGIFITAYNRYDRPLRVISQKERTSISDKAASLVEPMGTSLPLHATFATMFALGALAKRPKMREAAIVGLGSFYLSAVSTSFLKKSFQRHRPSNTDDSHLFDGADGNGQNTSFPSSHTSNAFAAATALASVYRDSKWVPQVAYGVATLVGLSRINDNKHWASDVLAGAALGYLTGKVSYWTFTKVKNQLQKRNWVVSPNWQSGAIGVNASLRF